MANPILQMLSNQGTSTPNPIIQMASMLRGNPNPNEMLNALAMQNPQLQQVMAMVNQNGGNPKEVFYALAKEHGVDPNDILNQINKR